jgi:hypothetical protein
MGLILRCKAIPSLNPKYCLNVIKHQFRTDMVQTRYNIPVIKTQQDLMPPKRRGQTVSIPMDDEHEQAGVGTMWTSCGQRHQSMPSSQLSGYARPLSPQK